MSPESAARPPYLEVLARIIKEVVEPSATVIDRRGVFPRAVIDAFGKAGLLGLVSARDVGGMGEGHRAATSVVEALARACGSTAMVVCMHYAAAVIEAHGSRKLREAIAAGRHLSTLAFSEVGSRSQCLGSPEHGRGRHGQDSARCEQELGDLGGRGGFLCLVEPAGRGGGGQHPLDPSPGTRQGSAFRRPSTGSAFGATPRAR